VCKNFGAESFRKRGIRSYVILMTMGVHNTLDLELLKGGDQFADRVEAPRVDHQPIRPVSRRVVHSPPQDAPGQTKSTHRPNVFDGNHRNSHPCAAILPKRTLLSKRSNIQFLGISRSDLSFDFPQDGESFDVAQDPEFLEGPVEPGLAMLFPMRIHLLFPVSNISRS